MAAAQKSSTVTKPADKKHGNRPLVLITGAAGDIGSALISALSKRYKVVGLDLEGKVVQIPSSVDELIATGQFLARRRKAGQPILRVFLFGDTDEGGGISAPWTLGASVLIGVWLMLTRLTLGASGVMADADHLIGSLVITVSVAAMAEAARPLRYINYLFGLALAIVPFVSDASALQTAAGVICGLALVALSVPRGGIRHRYGSWSRVIV